MTTVTQFTPSPLVPFQFQATLDGATYNCTVLWNTYGQRWYLQIADQGGNPIVLKPMVASPPDYPISLVAGYFVSMLVYVEATQQFVVSP